MGVSTKADSAGAISQAIGSCRLIPVQACGGGSLDASGHRCPARGRGIRQGVPGCPPLSACLYCVEHSLNGAKCDVHDSCCQSEGRRGKTTIATNLAGYLAGKHQRVVIPRHGSGNDRRRWLARRTARVSEIRGALPDADPKIIRDHAPRWLIVDAPACSRRPTC